MEADSGSEFNRLSGALNQRIIREMSDFMSTVSSQIQVAMNEAIGDQMLPRIQATLKSGQRQMPERIWENPARRPEYSSEEALDPEFRSDSRDEYYRSRNRNEDLESTHDRNLQKHVKNSSSFNQGPPFNFSMFCDRMDVEKAPRVHLSVFSAL